MPGRKGHPLTKKHDLRFMNSRKTLLKRKAGHWALFLLVPISIALNGGSGWCEPSISISPEVIPQGDIGLIKVELKEGETPKVKWLDHDVYMVKNDRNTTWYGFLGVDFKAKPGNYPVLVRVLPGRWEKGMELKVTEKDRGVRRLTLPKEMVDLDEPTLERVRAEAALMREVLNAPPVTPAWRGAFLSPVAGEVIGPFGQGSVINDAPREPHSGVDLKAEKGTPVVAMNHGRVALVADQFFSGLSIVIDHGGAVQSMYFHLDKVSVQQGEMVKKGQIIGFVGSTGRVTGSHLHLGVRINGARIDPLRLMNISEQMEQP